ncbi:MAG: hypothetical protein ACE15B_14870 [Bryobacteraceae bacterium]
MSAAVGPAGEVIAEDIQAGSDFALTHIRAGGEQVAQEVQAAGFRLLWRREHAPGRQYIAMFQVP